MKTNKDLVYMSLYCGLFIVLDILSNSFSIFRMPQGGSLSLGTIALILASYHLGWQKGTIICFISVLLMFVIGSINYYGIISFLFDYLLAYGVYGLSSCFKNYKYIYFGIIITSVIRTLFSTISGVWVWKATFSASLVYQLSYMMPTMLVDLVFVPILDKRVIKEHVSRNK